MSERRELTQEEVAALEAELDKITVDDVLLQTVVSLLNLGARKAGLGGAGGAGTQAPAPDLEQLGQAIEGARVLVPLLEPRHGEQLGPVRDTLSRLQLTYARAAGSAPPAAGEPAAPPAEEPAPQGPGPAQRSGRLWVPGQ